MKRILSPALCAGVILLSGVSAEAIMSPAFAQTDEGLDFHTIHDTLAPYGDWVYSDRWGLVWSPEDVPYDFRPYDTDGYWANTDYGWYWVSDYEWGDIPFHYGRWVNDPDDGWLWIPGYVWSPGWVVWRSSGRYVGWMPMPPDRTFLLGGNVSFGLPGFGLSFSFDDDYGYRRWYGRDYDRRFASNWVFVDQGHMADRDFHRHLAPRGNYAQFIRSGRDITHTSVSNNYVTNRSIDPRLVQRAGGRPVPVMHLDQVARHRQFVTTANQGQQTQMRMRQAIPHGTGVANSAPQPSQNVVQSLSSKVNRNGGRSGAHLFTRDTITNAPLKGPGGVRGQVGPNPPQPGGNAFPEQNGPTNSGPQTGPAQGTQQEFMRHREHAPPPNTPNGSTAPMTAPNQNAAPTPTPGGEGQGTSFTRHREHAPPPPNTPQGGTTNAPPSQNFGPGQTNPNGPSNETPFSERHQHTTNPNAPTQTETPPGNGPQGGPPQGGPNGNPERFRHMETNPGSAPNGTGPQGGPNGPSPNGGERFQRFQGPPSGQGPASGGNGPVGGPPGGQNERMHAPPPNGQGTQQQPQQGQGNPGKPEKHKHDENPPAENPH